MAENKETTMSWKGFISSIINSWPLVILIVLLLFQNVIRQKISETSNITIDKNGVSAVFNQMLEDYKAVKAMAASSNIQSMKDIDFLKQTAQVTPVYRSILAKSGVDSEVLTILDETEKEAKALLAGVLAQKENPEIANSVEILAAEGIDTNEIGTPEGRKRIEEVIAKGQREGRDTREIMEAKAVLEKEKAHLGTIPEVNPEVLRRVNPRELRSTATLNH